MTITVRELIKQLNTIDESRKDLPIFFYDDNDILEVHGIDNSISDRIDINPVNRG